jgi:hypothetical protein
MMNKKRRRGTVQKSEFCFHDNRQIQQGYLWNVPAFAN